MYAPGEPDQVVRRLRPNRRRAAPAGPERRARRSRAAIRPWWAATLFVAVAAMPADAQERRIVSNRIEVSQREASLSLEFSDGQRLAITLSGGRASVNGESLGPYEPGGPAEREWRDLLARAVSLSNGPLAEELRRWRPDPGVAGAERDLLAAIGGHFAGTLGEARAEEAGTDPGNGRALLRAMARSDDREALARALDGVDLGALTVLVGRDHVVLAGTPVDGGILLVDGELVVRGRVHGDAIVVDGLLTLAPGGRVDGDALLVNSRLEDPAGGVAGEVADISDRLRREERRNAERIRAEVRRELNRAPAGARRTGGFSSRVRQASSSTINLLVTFVVGGLLSWLATGMAGNRVNVVVRAISHQPARSALVGLAGGFAVIPAYLLGIVVLVATVLGIPLLIVWVPLFPVAAFAAALVGLVGVSDHVGKWVLRRGYRWLNRTGPGQPTYTRLLGLGTLFIPWVAGSWLQVLPLTGWVGGVVQAAGTMGFLLATATGFGAVILTRGGGRPTRWAGAYDDSGDDEEGGRW